MTREDLRQRLRHLLRQAQVLRPLELTAVHEGLPVWLLIAIVCDAVERTVIELEAVTA